MNEKMRIDWVDRIRGICIILVVLGHAILYTSVTLNGINSGASEFWKDLCTWIYSFHMPLFFLASGYLHSINESKRKRIYIRIFSITTIYFVFSFLFWIVKVFFSRNVTNTVTFNDLISIPIYPLGEMWFLYALLMMYLLREACRYFYFDHNYYLLVCLMISMVGYCVCWDEELRKTVIPRLMKNMFYYALGNELPTMIRIFNTHKVSKKISFGCFLIFAGIGCLWFVSINELSIILKGSLNIVVATMNLLAFVILSQLYDVRIFESVGKESLIVYLMHDYGVTGSVIFLKRFIPDISLMIIISTLSGMIFSLLFIALSKNINIINILFHPEKLVQYHNG